MTVSAVSPWRTAFWRERPLPSSVTGPVLSCALRRLASICRKEVILPPVEELGSFRYFDATLRRRLHHPDGVRTLDCPPDQRPPHHPSQPARWHACWPTGSQQRRGDQSLGSATRRARCRDGEVV